MACKSWQVCVADRSDRGDSDEIPLSEETQDETPEDAAE